MKRLCSVLLFCTTPPAIAAGPIPFSLVEIQQGVIKEAAINRYKALNYKVQPLQNGQTAILDAKTNEMLGALEFCGNTLFSSSTAAIGSAPGFVKRVAQLNESYGQPSVEAESRMTHVGEYNSIRLSWRKDGDQITLEFIPKTEGTIESQWLTYSNSTVCK